jgi:hypothetical protein
MRKRRALRKAATLGWVLSWLLGGCARQGSTPAKDSSAGDPWFEEVAAQAGVQFTCRSGHEKEYYFPEIILGGCALFDMDDDGDLDLYLVQGGSVLPERDDAEGNKLYRNDGNFHFTDITEGSGAADGGYGIGVAAGDCDNDGDTDLYITKLGRDTLLRNDGGGKFTDITPESGTGHPGWGTSAAFLDDDADGDLDLWVVNYVNWTAEGEFDCYNDFGAQDYCLPTNYGAPASTVLYRNEGGGRFTDISAEAGLRASFGNGLGITHGDFDRDGRMDVFIANDTMMNQLWLNRGNGRFEDEALLRGCALDEHGKAKAGMGVLAADPDDDGDLDVLVVNLDRESDSFYQNDGDYFSDRTAAVGLGAATRPYTRFGVGMIDFDNDGYLDLFEANGRVQSSPEPITADPYAEPNQLLRGTSRGVFEEVHPQGGTTSPLIATSRGAAFGDLDGDGGVDIVVMNRDAAVHILHNIVKDRGRWIEFRVREASGRDAIGAIVTATVGERKIRRDVVSAYSYASANDPKVHLGLGSAGRVQDVRVRWADGQGDFFGDFDANQVVELRRGTKPIP